MSPSLWRSCSGTWLAVVFVKQLLSFRATVHGFVGVSARGGRVKPTSFLRVPASLRKAPAPFSSSSSLSYLVNNNNHAAENALATPSLSFESTLMYDANDATTRLSTTKNNNRNNVVPARHVRWYSHHDNSNRNSNNNTWCWALQTAVTTWIHPVHGDTVELHAMVHFGDEAYYQVYNDDDNDDNDKSFSHNRRVLYELLLDDNMLEAETKPEQDSTSTNNYYYNFRRVMQPLSASPVDRQTAARYGWTCQVDILDYQQAGWRHADWTRQEFQQALQQEQLRRKKNQRNSWNLGLLGRGIGDGAIDNSNGPLWQQALSFSSKPSSSPSAATEAATALFVGPPTMASTTDTSRRLFSNLFLPGSSLAQFLRLTLWMTVPTPELSILLLDWSTSCATTSSTRQSRNRYSNNYLWQASWSPVTKFLLQAVWEARLDVIQRLAFGQVLLTGSRPSTTTNTQDLAQSLLIQGRNQRALQVLDQTLAEERRNNTLHKVKKKTVALLYGSSHCPDLSQSLRQRGFVPKSTAWRTAWSVSLASKNNDETNETTIASSPTSPSMVASPPTLPLWLVPASLYLSASGADWLASWQAVAHADSTADVLILAAAYGIRHVLLYLALSKVVLDWQKAPE